MDLSGQIDAGVYGGVTKSELEMKRGNSEVESDGYHLGGYLRYRQNSDIRAGQGPGFGGSGFRASIDGLYSRYNNDLSRRAPGTRLKASYHQDVISAGVEMAYDINLSDEPGQTVLTPFARARYTHLSQESVEDKSDSPLAMRAGQLKADQFTASAGAEISQVIDFENVSLKPSASLAWEHLFGDDRYAVSTRFKNYPGSSTRLRGVCQDRDALKLSLNLESLFRTGSEQDISLNLGYILDMRAHGLEHAVFGGVEIRF